MRDNLRYYGSVSQCGVQIKQYIYKNLSVCVSEDEEALDMNDVKSPDTKVLHISFDLRTSGMMKNSDMLFCAKRLGLNEAKPFKEYSIKKTNPLMQPGYLHYYEQVI